MKKIMLTSLLGLTLMLLTVFGNQNTYGAEEQDEPSVALDCRAIQRQIDALPPAGGTIRIRSGYFICYSPIIINKSNVSLVGQGASTYIQLADDANSPVLLIGDTTTPINRRVSNVRVADIVIDGNRHNQSMECWGAPCDSGGFSFIRNNGITIRGASHVMVEDVDVSNAISGGLVTEKDSRYIRVEAVTAHNNAFDGVAGYETENSLFNNLLMFENDAAGLSFDIDFEHNIVSNVVVSNNGTVGLFVQDSRYNLFENVQIRDSGESGIFLATPNDATSAPTHNTFTNLMITNWGTGGFCVDAMMAAGICVNNPTAVNNIFAHAQLIGDPQSCFREALAGSSILDTIHCQP